MGGGIRPKAGGNAYCKKCEQRKDTLHPRYDFKHPLCGKCRDNPEFSW